MRRTFAPVPPPLTVLLVEDETLTRLAAADHLRGCGYKVLEAGNSAEALAVLKAAPSVDVVVTDIQMPGRMDGFGLARWIRAHRPESKVILTSGYVRTSEAAAALCADAAFLEKPYAPRILDLRIRALFGTEG